MLQIKKQEICAVLFDVLVPTEASRLFHQLMQVNKTFLFRLQTDESSNAYNRFPTLVLSACIWISLFQFLVIAFISPFGFKQPDTF